MHRLYCTCAVAVAFALSVSTASAFQRGNGGGHKPSTPSSSAPSTKTQIKAPAHGPKTTTAKAQGPKTQSGQTHGPKTQTAKGPSTKTTLAKGSSKKTTVAKGPSKTTPSTTEGKSSGTTRSTTTDSTVTLTPVQQKLQRNTNLAQKLSDRLPANTNLMTAAKDFRNLGQFVAAVNVSNNLGIPFGELKTRMVDDGMSLGQAIKDARPTADSTFEARRAETTADAMIRETEVSAVGRPQTKKNTKTKTKSKPSSGLKG